MNVSTYKTGYSLVEVLVAITILLLAIAGPMTIASKGLQSSFYARDQLTAYMLAQEGVEAIISIRNEHIIAEVQAATPDFSYASLWGWAKPTDTLGICYTNGCNLDIVDATLANNVVDCGAINDCLMDYDPSASGRAHYYLNDGTGANDSPFTRVIRLTETQPDKETEVEVSVTWNPTIFGTGTKTVTLRTALFNTYGN